MPNSDSQPVKIKRNNFSQTPISCLPQNSCLNSANDIPSSSYGPSFIRAKQLNDIHKSGLLCKESLSNKAHSNSGSHNDRCPIDLNTFAGHKNILRASNPSKNISFTRTSASLSSFARLRSCDEKTANHLTESGYGFCARQHVVGLAVQSWQTFLVLWIWRRWTPTTTISLARCYN